MSLFQLELWLPGGRCVYWDAQAALLPYYQICLSVVQQHEIVINDQLSLVTQNNKHWAYGGLLRNFMLFCSSGFSWWHTLDYIWKLNEDEEYSYKQASRQERLSWPKKAESNKLKKQFQKAVF